jgi:hypothetical protein
MGNDEKTRRAVAVHFSKQAKHAVGGLRIQIPCGLIGQYQGRLRLAMALHRDK